MSSLLQKTLGLPLIDKGDVMLHASLDVHFFFRATIETEENPQYHISDPLLPSIEVAAGIIFREHRAFLSKLGQTYRFMCNPQTQHWKAIDEKTHCFTPDVWLRMNAPGMNYFIHYHNGQQADDATDSYFIMSMKRSSSQDPSVHDPSLGYLSVGVPVSVVDSEPLFCEYLQLVERWTAHLSPLHGYVGITLTPNNYRREEMQPIEYQLVQKLPGLDFHYRPHFCFDLGTNRTHIKGISWLTIVHKDLLTQAALLEKDSIANACPDAHIISLENNIIFQAAASPELFDLSPSYQQIAKYLEPIRYQGLKSPHGNSTLATQTIFDDTSYQAWLSRFTA